MYEYHWYFSSSSNIDPLVFTPPPSPRGSVPMIIPLTLRDENCSDLAGIFSMTSFNYLKKSYFKLWFLSRTVKKLLTILHFYLLKIYNSALFKKMFHKSVLSASFMSQGLRTVEIIQISLVLIEI
jgi:hypothetical protein